ncbi:MAG: sigma-70 family RNA polymerase sigma factor [Planctomycetales bacterium]|nr:sigma-70 family RNA polymerase sigma factor [Planctomycetales bacterium]
MPAVPENSDSEGFRERVRELFGSLQDLGVDALGALFDLTSQRLVRYAATVTRNQHDAEDAVQTALVTLAARPERLRGIDCPWAYLLRMVRNESLLIGRRKKRWLGLESLADLFVVRRVDEVELQETHAVVWAALRRLPTDQAEVVVLKIWEDLTFAQIAEILELSPNTAASRYQYGMAKLQRSLSGRNVGVPQ